MFRKRKKYRRQLDDIGKRKYSFDLKEEKKYYNYLSCSHMKKKDKNSLEDQYRFDSYKKWKQYITVETTLISFPYGILIFIFETTIKKYQQKGISII